MIEFPYYLRETQKPHFLVLSATSEKFPSNFSTWNETQKIHNYATHDYSIKHRAGQPQKPIKMSIGNAKLNLFYGHL